MKIPLLQGEWRKLVFVNYAIDKEILMPYLPIGTELDILNDKCYISLVAFTFEQTKVLGIKIPFHREFEAINLRFYVRRNDNGIVKAGAVSIKEIVPLGLISVFGNAIFNEKYATEPVRHKWNTEYGPIKIKYRWKLPKWNTLKVKADERCFPIKKGGEEEWIMERHWCYTKAKDHVTKEYYIEHPRWETYRVIGTDFKLNFDRSFGKEFQFLNDATPQSVFLAEGSAFELKDRGNFNIFDLKEIDCFQQREATSA